MKKLAILVMVLGMSLSAFALNVGVVNTTEIIQMYSQSKKLNTNLQSKSKTYQTQLQTKEAALRKLGQDLQKKGDKVTEADKTKFETQRKSLETFVRSSQSKLAKEQSEGLQKIESAISATIKSVAKSKKLDFVFEDGAIRYGGTDITQDVLKKLESSKRVSL